MGETLVAPAEFNPALRASPRNQDFIGTHKQSEWRAKHPPTCYPKQKSRRF